MSNLRVCCFTVPKASPQLFLKDLNLSLVNAPVLPGQVVRLGHTSDSSECCKAPPVKRECSLSTCRSFYFSSPHETSGHHYFSRSLQVRDPTEESRQPIDCKSPRWHHSTSSLYSLFYVFSFSFFFHPKAESDLGIRPLWITLRIFLLIYNHSIIIIIIIFVHLLTWIHIP